MVFNQSSIENNQAFSLFRSKTFMKKKTRMDGRVLGYANTQGLVSRIKSKDKTPLNINQTSSSKKVLVATSNYLKESEGSQKDQESLNSPEDGENEYKAKVGRRQRAATITNLVANEARI